MIKSKILDKQNLSVIRGTSIVIVSFFTFIIFTYSLLQLIQKIDIGENEKIKVIKAYQSEVVAHERYPELYLFDKLKLATLDFWSECLVIGHAFSKSSVPFIDHPISEFDNNITDCEELVLAMKTPNIGIGYYPQYIHADSAVVKLILLTIDLTQGKIILVLLLLVMSTILSVLIYLKNRIIGVIFILYIFVITDTPFQGLNYAHGIATLWALIIITLFVLWNNKSFVNKAIISVIGGSGYAFLSQMHNPIQFIGLIILVNLIFDFYKSKDVISSVKNSTFFGIIWGIGGAVTILIHWTLVGIYESQDLMTNTLKMGVSNRVEIDLLNSAYYFFGLLKTQTFNFSLPMIGLLFIFFIWGRISNYPYREINFNFSTILLLFSPTVLIIFWFIVMGGHIGHGWTINLIYTALLNVLIVEEIIRVIRLEVNKT